MKKQKRKKLNTQRRRAKNLTGKIVDTSLPNSSRNGSLTPAFQKSEEEKKRYNKSVFKKIVAVLLAFVIVGVGYTGMDIYLTRHAKPAEDLIKSKTAQGSFSEISLDFSSMMVESVSFDNSTMLSAVIANSQTAFCNSVCFNAKRDDGSIGYQSGLATIDTFSMVSNGGSDTKGSIQKLIDNDILPVARICCYKDNSLPLKDKSLAVKDGNKIYTDKNGNTYLNPNNETVYGYISDIVRELYTFGVKVFVFYDYDLPEEISSLYNDGFDSLSTRLSKELNNDVKIMKEVDVSIKGVDAETGKIKNSAISKEIKKLDKLENNQVFYISTSIDDARVSDQLVSNSVGRFIIGE